MSVTPSGISIDFKDLQVEKLFSPILLTPSPIVTDVKPDPSKALVGIPITLFGMTI